MKRFHKASALGVGIITFLALDMTLNGCKLGAKKTTASVIKGFSAAELPPNEAIDYAQLMAKPKVSMTFFFTYEEFYNISQDPQNEAVKQAGTFIGWLTDTANTTGYGGGFGAKIADPTNAATASPLLNAGVKFNAMPTVVGFDKSPVDGSPIPAWGGDIPQPDDTPYLASFEAPARNGKPAAHIDVVLVRSVYANPNPADLDGDGNPRLTTPDSFPRVFGKALATSDVIVFNGHIWEWGENPKTGQKPKDHTNTQKILAGIAAAGGRQSYGVVFMNVCDSETIESLLLNDMSKGGALKLTLLSNAYQNTYANHARQSRMMVEDLYAQLPLQNVMLDMMMDAALTAIRRLSTNGDTSVGTDAYNKTFRPTVVDPSATAAVPASTTAAVNEAKNYIATATPPAFDDRGLQTNDTNFVVVRSNINDSGDCSEGRTVVVNQDGTTSYRCNPTAANQGAVPAATLPAATTTVPQDQAVPAVGPVTTPAGQ